ncbi:PqiC family protein [Azospirillum doebereinerae]
MPSLPRRSILKLLMAAAAVPIGLPGCSSAPQRLYVLTPLPRQTVTPQRNGRSIGVQAITLPEYLDRPEIISHAGPNELATSPDDRWAEPLPANMTRVVAENLSVLLGTDRVHTLPSRREEEADYEVAIAVDRFERTTTDNSVLDARWVILNGGTQKVVVSNRTRLTAPVSGDGYAALVAAMNETLTALSRDVAKDIANLRPRKTAQSGS